VGKLFPALCDGSVFSSFMNLASGHF